MKKKTSAEERKEYFKNYYLKHKEKIKERVKKRYRQKPEECRAAVRQWRDQNPELCKQYNDDHYAQRKKALAEYRKLNPYKRKNGVG